MNPVTFIKEVEMPKKEDPNIYAMFLKELKKLLESEPGKPANDKAIAAFYKLGALDVENLCNNKLLEVGRNSITNEIFPIKSDVKISRDIVYYG